MIKTTVKRLPFYGHTTERNSKLFFVSYCTTGFVKIGLNVASKVFFFFLSTGRLHGSLGCRFPNMEAYYKPSSPYALQDFSIIVQFVIADSKKAPRKGVAKARGRVLCSVYCYMN